MAERGAHLTTTLQPKPSIFEVVASDSLNQTFQPAILRLCNSLAAINPEKYGFLVRYYDELFLAMNSAVQQYYIRMQAQITEDTLKFIAVIGALESKILIQVTEAVQYPPAIDKYGNLKAKILEYFSERHQN
ncbi:Peroxisome assembly protein 12 [Pseudolycoriella hygida]|uniref:Peroxisome assembly protein 12 n=1 Tax=Pseudolycoriella hygida TaxID=35572 RepID=A0A9Q0MTQ5_9DIPT|nr:Peroxisome assembly protein 12 [Pseudolycoriella hygida]